MHRLLSSLALAMSLALSFNPARADDAAAIRTVIADQLAAFDRGDLEAAFAHASPGIQARFGDPRTFGDMVRSGYPMVWDPGRYEMRALSATPRGQVQTVMFEDAAGILWEADYLMEKVGGVWRIAGVALRRLPGVGS